MAKIIIGITSSIAIYKTLDLVSRLRKDGHQVFCLLTRHAQKMISQQTFNAVSGTNTDSSMFNRKTPGLFPHLDIAKEADLFAVIPATANIIGKLACGLADDMLTTTALAVSCQKILAPAMNSAMWHNYIVRANISRLKEFGYTIIEPDDGMLACGDHGQGRLKDISIIYEIIISFCRSRLVKSKNSIYPAIAGKRVLITAGGSIEMIDPVRFIGNSSSGKMGRELALEASAAGCIVHYYYGNISSEIPPAEHSEHFTTAEDLFNRLVKIIDSIDILIMAAAVADFKPAVCEESKIKKSERFNLPLISTIDVLKSLKKRSGQIFAGFAAETGSFKNNALKKCREKNCDLIIMNPVGGAAGIGSDYNEVTVFEPDGRESASGVKPKNEIAKFIMEKINEKAKQIF
ncbi:MAG: hypothetical protein A2096_03290 [Spirochaetes bacterium GWF1_41_5]|nr:MAG: hypothetical protein A2096_03290 [Spirochaetes bacterium GWF1_41_5]